MIHHLGYTVFVGQIWKSHTSHSHTTVTRAASILAQPSISMREALKMMPSFWLGPTRGDILIMQENKKYLFTLA